MQQQRDDDDREERRAERQAAREEHRAELERCREERREERESLREERQALAAQQLAALNAGGRSQYRIGLALKDFRSFDGTPGSDGAAYLLELTHLLGTHEIPAAMWPRELSLKLTGKAANWYASRFPGLHSGTFPPWGDLYAAMLLAYSHLYQAAVAYQELHSATRLAGTTGKEALNRVDELAMLLRRKGVNKPGHEEQQAYILQNQLAAEELPRWISLANADATVSDAALNDLELRSTDASAGRNSCPPQTREAFFAVRNDHLRNFLRDQGRATTGGRSVGSTSARAAVSSGDSADTAPAPRVTCSTPCPAPGRLPAEDTAEVKALKATWTTRSLRGGPAPLYHGPTAQHRAANEATYAARTAAQECFGCDVHGELVPNQPHWECKLHGAGASEATKSKRVTGSGGGGRHRA